MVGRVQQCVDGPRLLRMHLGELVPHSLGWNCALGVGVSVELRSWGCVVDPLPWGWGRGWLQYV